MQRCLTFATSLFLGFPLSCLAEHAALTTLLDRQHIEFKAVRTVDNVQPSQMMLSDNWSLSGGFAKFDVPYTTKSDHVWSATAYYHTDSGVRVGLGMGETIVDEQIIQPVRHYRLALGYDLAQRHSDVMPVVALSRVGGDIEMTAGLAVSLSF